VIPPGTAFIADPGPDGRAPFFVNLLVGHLDRGVPGPSTAYNVVAVACSGSVCGPAATVTMLL
jgi:hypothetical protein